MKKLIFLLTNLLIASPVILADSCSSSCSTSCNTSCNSSSSSSCNGGDCLPTHGQTYRRVDNEFQNGTPLFVSLFSTDVIRNLEEDDKHGALQVTVFGGKNTKHSDSAKYFFPYGFDKYTFDGSIVNPATFAQNIAWRQVLAGGTAAGAGVVQETVDYDNGAFSVSSTGAVALTAMEFNSDQTTYKFDTNTDKSKLLPWNFGITYAALFEPLGASAVGAQAGTGLITSPAFKSTIAPKYFYSHVGAGLALRYHFSDDKQGFFGQISTAVENVKSKICLNENVIQEKTELNATNFPVQNAVMGTVTTTSNQLADNPYGLTTAQLNAGAPAQTYLVGASPTDTPVAFTHKSSTAVANLSPYLAQAAPKGSINAAYLNGTLGTGFPADEQEGTSIANTEAPQNVAQAFMQSAWKYGHMGCQQSVTRLADIELLFGYQWLCSDCASNNWYLGIVIPTGNKPCANFVAPAVVGNGQHVALMVGSSLELMLSENECRSCWYRLDTNSRYLFKNTQMRSFDLKGNEWSRYMMVWENQEAYTAALAVVDPATGTPGADRNYTPGINVFTANMKVTPGFQIRLNQAVYFKAEKFSAELGWNVFGRAQECVKFACSWDAAPAFADSSYIGGVALNNSRTIYNDAQTMAANATANLNNVNGAGHVYNLANTTLNTTANQNLYEQFAITEDQANLASAATPAAVIQTPYAVLGYAWGCGDYKPVFSIGAQYEFTGNNRALNQWMVWGKFEFAF